MRFCSTRMTGRDSLCAMSKTFRLWNVDQSWLLPPSINEFVPAGHLSHFVRETVRGDLDLSAILVSYKKCSVSQNLNRRRSDSNGLAVRNPRISESESGKY